MREVFAALLINSLKQKNPPPIHPTTHKKPPPPPPSPYRHSCPSSNTTSLYLATAGLEAVTTAAPKSSRRHALVAPTPMAVMEVIYTGWRADAEMICPPLIGPGKHVDVNRRYSIHLSSLSRGSTTRFALPHSLLSRQVHLRNTCIPLSSYGIISGSRHPRPDKVGIAEIFPPVPGNLHPIQESWPVQSTNASPSMRTFLSNSFFSLGPPSFSPLSSALLRTVSHRCIHLSSRGSFSCWAGFSNHSTLRRRKLLLLSLAACAGSLHPNRRPRAPFRNGCLYKLKPGIAGVTTNRHTCTAAPTPRCQKIVCSTPSKLRSRPHQLQFRFVFLLILFRKVSPVGQSIYAARTAMQCSNTFPISPGSWCDDISRLLSFSA